MIVEIPKDLPPDQVELLLAKKNHAGDIVYLLTRVLDRFEHIHKGKLPPEEADFLDTVVAKVKAAHDAMKDWSDEEDDGTN